MAITAQQVKELRERTGAGMMECKTVLSEADGNMDAAIDLLRKRGLAKADKKAGRVAAEGVVTVASSADQTKAVIVELNCETDFVAKNDDFVAFARRCAETALAQAAALEDLAAGEIEETRKSLVSKLGENIALRRVQHMSVDSGRVGTYQHGSRIGVLVAIAGDASEELGRDLAMHVAASRPEVVKPEDVSAERVAKEKEILIAQAADSGKPREIIEKMISGRMSKFLNEIALTGQPFVKNPDQTVGDLLNAAGNATVLEFARFEVGEGIEKAPTADFASEVMAQVRGS
ncbi:elongation factor Ts [Acidithiobacillus sp. CV18-2]|uniref:Elongation factor Ts n=1 Tax=Igneacidithiobacillus copahuensis TaxID=2724909 RepID=A0AAE2YQV5_9PROT|nr:translation elongation factor Ts [Igneacidithiobacillus copahuensis]MBU2753495.1 elongation factor Ts [Acidithiobacillus sp. CV18-3]MBU2757113.1 elongation factor Ts [Acidithiobacillus sp. BN09-2]MBU2775989.1 elongation factor Ts [Acidithiobacillus sp. CV18-2]MBU2795880.1 elongation factor Ts [Acidithiobacillus sp. VAN18-2]MBU2800334.1 elongation factor Ts [Acidithiobacillus sp. VAN18-4]UTV79862.1 translation elongation factor Ts [Acidithiobacillus sp. YTS05]